MSTPLDLSTLVVGSPVAWIQRQYGRPEAYTGTVTRLTPTQLVVTTPREIVHRFRRSDGRMIGGSGYGPILTDIEDPGVVRLRRDARVRGAVRDIETLARAIDTNNLDPIAARTTLGRISGLADKAIRDLAS